MRRHDLLARDGDETRYLDLIARHVPDALNQPAEPAALNVLSRAQDHGWQAERLLRAVASTTDFSDAGDPAALLTARLNSYVTNHEPPARTAYPAPHDVARWRAIVTRAVPDTPVEAEQWNIVWRHAAGGVVSGLDVDTALEGAAAHLIEQASNDPMPPHRYTAHALVAELAHQYDAGGGHHPALPWLATPDFGHPGDHTGRIERLATLNAEISERMSQLRDRVLRERPAWTTALGSRPDEPRHAQQWDDTVGLAAAYRETYGITTNDGSSPLGRQPFGNDGKAEAWQQITNQWRQLMTTPGQASTESDTLSTMESRRDALLDEFRSDVADLSTNVREDHEADRLALLDRAEDEDLRDAENTELHRSFGY